MSKTGDAKRDEMTFVGHLKELRLRLVYSLIALGLCFLVLFIFANDLYGYVSEPLRAILPEGSTMIATDVTSPFFAPFRLALFFSLVISMPVILLQVWLFVAPGLYKNEKRFAIPMFFFSVFLFYAGMAFAYYVVFRLVFGFFLSVGPESVVPMTDISSYLSFVLKLLIAFGLAFQVPIATLLLLRAGLVERATLARQRPYIFIGCFVFGMLITPPDIFSQAFVAVPMWVLFELGLVMHRFMGSGKQKEESDDPDDDPDDNSDDGSDNDFDDGPDDGPTPAPAGQAASQTPPPGDFASPDFSRKPGSRSSKTAKVKPAHAKKATTRAKQNKTPKA